MTGKDERRDLDRFVKQAANLRGHTCMGLPLGVKMALKGMSLMRLVEGFDRDNMMVVVENNKCPVDGIQVVTGCTAGSRRLTVLNYGKSAAVFYDGRTGRGYRVTTRRDYVKKAVELAIADGLIRPNQPVDALSQLERKVMLNAFSKLPMDELLESEEVQVHDELLQAPRMQRRVNCSACGEEIMDGKGIRKGRRTLCPTCAQGNYYESGRKR